MFGHQSQDFDAMMKPGIEAFNYWISFFPTAPLFGVEWRFGNGLELPMANAAAFVTPLAPQATPTAGKKAEPKKTPAKAESKPADVIPLTRAPVQKPAPKKVAPVAEKPAPAPKTEAPVAKAAAPAKPAAKPAKTAAKKKSRSGKPVSLLSEAPASVDDLKLIKGIGPGLEKQLNGLGVYQFQQIAEFSDKDLTWIDNNLTAFKGRCFRDDWCGQAKGLLA